MLVHEERVGEWITVRRDELGMTVRDFAAALRVDAKTVGNVESGRTAVRIGTRARWEDVLGWERGSLTAAYKRGERPELARPTPPTGDPVETFVRDNVPANKQDAALAMLRALIEGEQTKGDRKIG